MKGNIRASLYRGRLFSFQIVRDDEESDSDNDFEDYQVPTEVLVRIYLII